MAWVRPTRFDRRRRHRQNGCPNTSPPPELKVRATPSLPQSDASAANPSAQADLAGRLLLGRDAPRDPDRGLAVLRAALARGDGEAAAVLATLHAAGAWVPQDWDLALDFLETAAIRGSERARGQLCLLALASPLAPMAVAPDRSGDGDAPWRRLRRAIDLAAWLSPPGRRPLWETPRVRASERFVHPAVCDWLVGLARGRMRAALMYHAALRQEIADPHRTCSDFEFDIVGSDLIVVMVRSRVSILTSLPTAAMEPPRIFHYATGQEIKPHYDRLNDGTGYGADAGYRGDRIATFLLYLNDDFDGGDLDFPKVNQRFKGAKGDAVYFAHVDAAGAPDPLSLHAGLPIRHGEKWVLSQWIHDRPLTT